MGRLIGIGGGLFLPAMTASEAVECHGPKPRLFVHADGPEQEAQSCFFVALLEAMVAWLATRDRIHATTMIPLFSSGQVR